MESCHLQKFSDDTAIVGTVVNGPEDKYRGLVDNFLKWCGENHLQLNMAKTKEMVVDFGRNRSPPSPVCIGDTDVEMVTTHKYLDIQMYLYLLPTEGQVLQCVQWDAPHALPVCCCEYHLLCCGVLGHGHKSKMPTD